MKKILISPKYHHNNNYIWEEMNACWIVNSDDELEIALLKLLKSLKYKPYSQKNVDKLIKRVVYGGFINKDVLGRYSDFMLSKSL